MRTVDDYLNLITSEHRGQPDFSAVVTIATQLLADLQAFLFSLPQQFDLDLCIGVQEDIVGIWVGRSRWVITPIPDVFFSFDVPGLGWDQGIWQGPYDPTQGLSRLDDDTYRTLLRAKILANNWDGTLAGASAALQELFPPDSGSLVFIDDHQDMHIVIGMSGQLQGPLMTALFLGGYVPVKPEGVAVDYMVVSVNGTAMFGFDAENDYVSGWDVGSWGLVGTSLGTIDGPGTTPPTLEFSPTTINADYGNSVMVSDLTQITFGSSQDTFNAQCSCTLGNLSATDSHGNSVAGSGGRILNLTNGSRQDVKSLLNSLTYTAPNSGSSDSITVTVIDSLNASVSTSIKLLLSNVKAPVLSIAPVGQTLVLNTSTTIGSGISFSSSASGTFSMSATCTHGKLATIDASGSPVAGSGTNSIAFSSDFNDVTAAFDNLIYTAPASGNVDNVLLGVTDTFGQSATAALAVTLASAQPLTRPLLGAFVGSPPASGNGGGFAEMANIESLVGHNMDFIFDFIDFSSWSNWLSEAQWMLGAWQGSAFKRPIVVSIPMLVTGASHKQGAAGAYDSNWTAMGNLLKAKGRAGAKLRIGWEFDGSWFPWTARADQGVAAADFITYWQRIVGILSSISPQWTFDWCVAGVDAPTINACYPGDKYVHYIGMDVYDRGYPLPSGAVARWNAFLNGNNGVQSNSGFGLLAHSALCLAHNKPRSFPEWGSGTAGDGSGSGDDPAWVNNMIAWLTDPTQPPCAYAAYWDYDAAGDFDGLLAHFSGNQSALVTGYQNIFNS